MNIPGISTYAELYRIIVIFQTLGKIRTKIKLGSNILMFADISDIFINNVFKNM